VLNDVQGLVDMQDRLWLLRKLEELGVPTPHSVDCSRGNGKDPALEEHEDYVVINGHRINKPFVEKPVDRRNRDIYVYFPKESGGGRALLSTRESGDVEYVCRFDPESRCVRRQGSFIYQEYLQSEGFVLHAVCVGGLAYGNAIPSGVVYQQAMEPRPRTKSGGDSPCPVFLRQEEKFIALKLSFVLQQTLFGLTFVRSQTSSGKATSYVIDVWPGIPRAGLGTHSEDVVRSLLAAVQRRMQPWSPAPATGMRPRSRSLPKFKDKVLKEAAGNTSEDASPGSLSRSSTDGFPQEPCLAPPARPCSSSATSSGEGPEPEDDLLCVLLVARHAARTPKQKVKAKLQLKSEFAAGFLCGWLAGENVGAPVAAAAPATFDLRSPEQLARLDSGFRQLMKEGHELGTLVDALGCIGPEGVAFHAKVGADGPKLVVGLKWGGEVTSTGVAQAELFGRSFRKETYPMESIDELHATLRHDIKVYASKEPRCKQTAASFCKGLLRLASPLPPIVAALVRTDELGRLDGGALKNYAIKGAGEDDEPEKEGLPPTTASWAELESFVGFPCVPENLRAFDTADAALRELRARVEEVSAVLQRCPVFPAASLYGGETPALLRERYQDALADLGTAEEPRLNKVQKVLDHLQYDHVHNAAALTEDACTAMEAAVPLCEALYDLLGALELGLTRQAGICDNVGCPLLGKLRWDLRVASDADLGEESAHLHKHEALYAATKVAMGEGGGHSVRTRLYFTHNSQLEALLGMIAEKNDNCGCEFDPSLPATRLGFLAHFIVRLTRKREDKSLWVSLDFSRDGGSADKVRLFNLPFAQVDAWWSGLIAESCGSSP